MRKIRDFLPEECVEDFEYDICEYPDKFLNPNGEITPDEVIRVFRDWLNTETTAELEGVKPVKKTLGGLAEFFFCGNCEDCDVMWTEHGNRHHYCPNCGAKIDWSGAE